MAGAARVMNLRAQGADGERTPPAEGLFSATSVRIYTPIHPFGNRLFSMEIELIGQLIRVFGEFDCFLLQNIKNMITDCFK